MPKPSLIPPLLLILCSLSLVMAFSPTLKANYFYLDQQNYVPFELYQTRNGIIAFSNEAANSDYTSTETISQYVLIDISKRDAKAILTDLVSACEDIDVTPYFQYLHYHAKTDTLSYFCYANNSLLLIDQSSYTVSQVIPFTTTGQWPVVKLSTEGMGIAILLMQDLQVAQTLTSLLVKVDLQSRTVTAEIPLDQGFAKGESVVAYASGKKGSYVATNKIQGQKLATKIYSFTTIGKKYQVTQLASFSTSVSEFTSSRVLTKLFCFGNFIVTNNGQDLYFLNQQGGINTQVKGLPKRSSNCKDTHFYDLAVTAQPEGTYLYLMEGTEAVAQYSLIADVLHTRALGYYSDIKIAYGNGNSDLMFTIDIEGYNFTIYDLPTMKEVYFAPAGFSNHMMTDTTYVVLHNEAHIFDLKSNELIDMPRVPNTYYYAKEQNILSQWLGGVLSNCTLQHVDFTSGKSWITRNYMDKDSCGDLDKLRLTDNGNPEYLMHTSLDDYQIFTETDGLVNFKTGDINFHRGINFDFDSLTFIVLSSNTDKNQTNITSYAYNPQSKKVEYRDSNLLSGISGGAFAYVNATQTVMIGDNVLFVIDGLGKTPQKYSFPQTWNSVSSFQDLSGNNYVITSNWNILGFNEGSVPGLLVNGKITDLPGTRKESARAQAAGVNSYWVADHLHQSFGAVRFYSADSSKRAGEKISI